MPKQEKDIAHIVTEMWKLSLHGFGKVLCLDSAPPSMASRLNWSLFIFLQQMDNIYSSSTDTEFTFLT